MTPFLPGGKLRQLVAVPIALAKHDQISFHSARAVKQQYRREAAIALVGRWTLDEFYYVWELIARADSARLARL